MASAMKSKEDILRSSYGSLFLLQHSLQSSGFVSPPQFSRPISCSTVNLKEASRQFQWQRNYIPTFLHAMHPPRGNRQLYSLLFPFPPRPHRGKRTFTWLQRGSRVQILETAAQSPGYTEIPRNFRRSADIQHSPRTKNINRKKQLTGKDDSSTWNPISGVSQPFSRVADFFPPVRGCRTPEVYQFPQTPFNRRGQELNGGGGRWSGDPPEKGLCEGVKALAGGCLGGWTDHHRVRMNGGKIRAQVGVSVKSQPRIPIDPKWRKIFVFDSAIFEPVNIAATEYTDKEIRWPDTLHLPRESVTSSSCNLPCDLLAGSIMRGRCKMVAEKVEDHVASPNLLYWSNYPMYNIAGVI